jgi:hypothetical protein
MAYKTIKSNGIPFKYKDGFGAGNSSTENVVPNNVVNDKETYIGGKGKKEVDMNKIKHTRVGDDIHYYQNGVEGRGIVVKMSNEYVLVAKDDGDFEDIHINDTFFVKDIVVNKTWDMMDSGERMEMLTKAHAPSARFVTKDWYNLPVELRDVLTKFTGSTSEAGISRPDETKTHRDQDQSLAANNPTTDDEQAKGLKKDGDYGGSRSHTTGKKGKCRRCGNVHPEGTDHVYGKREGTGAKKGYSDDFKEGGTSQQQAETKKKKKKGKKCVSCGKVHATKSDIEHGAYGAISTDTPLDVSEDTGYEERPHICAECVGNLPREDAKGHHDKETEDKKSPAKVKEPHVVEGETSHPKEKAKLNPEKFANVLNEASEEKYDPEVAAGRRSNIVVPSKEKEKSEQFRKIYGGGKKRKKGVPEWNVNTWGINYAVKEDGEEEETY